MLSVPSLLNQEKQRKNKVKHLQLHQNKRMMKMRKKEQLMQKLVLLMKSKMEDSLVEKVLSGLKKSNFGNHQKTNHRQNYQQTQQKLAAETILILSQIQTDKIKAK
jgi:uncharacterized protein YdiU (UPF0061 family)